MAWATLSKNALSLLPPPPKPIRRSLSDCVVRKLSRLFSPRNLHDLPKLPPIPADPKPVGAGGGGEEKVPFDHELEPRAAGAQLPEAVRFSFRLCVDRILAESEKTGAGGREELPITGGEESLCL